MSSIKEFQHLHIPLQDLQSATDDFADSNCIGHGGFGKVYKGKIRLSGELTMVAIKRLDRSLGQGTREFWKEIMMLSQYKHKNLVSLLGFCDEGGEMLLVYEYLSKKSLNLYLSLPNLCWHTRLVICLGAAKGLTYLHEPMEGCQERVLHRDIKSANILLDDNWQPKIADFGLSRLGPANQQITFVHSNAVGTPGYCDPLYQEEGFLTKESDVYSFGVVLFEVLCGRPAFVEIKHNHDIYRSLTWLARKCYEEKKLDTIIFTGIRETISPKSLERFSAIAYQCLHKDRKERPSMAKIVKEIEIAYLYQELKTKISLPEVALKEIEAATENFKMCIWENDQYQIYKGELSISGKPATTVFEKRFRESKGDMLRGFLAQIKILSPSPQPPNTMSLVGYCDGEKDKIIVHEYAERGSLDQYIRRRSNNTTLTWLQRLEICCGAARGLDQFHERDIMHEAFQSTKILLDSKWVAKVAGFTISVPSSSTGVDVAAYSSPEYIASGKASKEADVYSLGVVLFEVLCGRLCTEALDGYKLSAEFIKELYEKKKVDDIVDPFLREQNMSVDKYSAIAYRCLLDDPKQRPSVGAVIHELEKLKTNEVECEKRVKKLQDRAKAAEERAKAAEERTKAAEEREKVATEREKEMQAKMELIEKKLAVAAEREKKMQMELIEKEQTLREEMEERMKKKCLFF